ncbi:MAG: VOC family protein [Steroidobacteraceae bacterium]
MRFHEVSLPTVDIRASVEFYERLGFTQAQTGDVWPHPYGVLTDGRIVLGLHQQPEREASVCFVRPDVARYADELERRGCTLEYRRTGTEEFHQIALRDPAGHLIVVLEARTYSPPMRESDAASPCGELAALALPAADFEAARRFWEPLGFVAGDAQEQPFAHLPLTSDHLDILFHRVRTLAGPALVFAEGDLLGRSARLRGAGSEPVPLDPVIGIGIGIGIRAPEGTRLLWLAADL